VVLWFCPEILEDTLLPEPFHVVPVLDLTMSDGVVETICPGVSLQYPVMGHNGCYLARRLAIIGILRCNKESLPVPSVEQTDRNCSGDEQTMSALSSSRWIMQPSLDPDPALIVTGA
jgi:hypothetical protein